MDHRAARICIILFATALSVLARAQPSPEAGAGEHKSAEGFEYTDKVGHWHVRIPGEWSVGPEELLKAANAEAAKLAGKFAGNFRYVLLLIPTSPARRTSYILVQETPTSDLGATYDQIEAELKSQNPDKLPAEVKEATRGLIEATSTTQPVLDRVRNRYTTTSTQKATDGKELKSVWVTYLGRGSNVQFNCYATSDTFDAQMPAFARITDSFAYDPGYEFVPGGPNDAGRPMWTSGALVGGLVGVGAALVYGLSIKGRKDAAKPPADGRG